jgi:hypothetical protein
VRHPQFPHSITESPLNKRRGATPARSMIHARLCPVKARSAQSGDVRAAPVVALTQLLAQTDDPRCCLLRRRPMQLPVVESGHERVQRRSSLRRCVVVDVGLEQSSRSTPAPAAGTARWPIVPKPASAPAASSSVMTLRDSRRSGSSAGYALLARGLWAVRVPTATRALDHRRQGLVSPPAWVTRRRDSANRGASVPAA